MEYTSDIFGKAEQLLGSKVSADRSAALTAMCQAAGSELEARLRDGVSAEEIEELFVSAAGVLALSMYIQLGAVDDVSSFSAGNVSMSRKSTGETAASAAALRAQAENMLIGYLKDRGFDFTGVRG